MRREVSLSEPRRTAKDSQVDHRVSAKAARYFRGKVSRYLREDFFSSLTSGHSVRGKRVERDGRDRVEREGQTCVIVQH